MPKHNDIYEEIDYHIGLLDEYATCSFILGQYVEANTMDGASALLRRLSVILKTLETDDEE